MAALGAARRRSFARGDAGYSVLEIAIVLPVVFLLIMLVVQVGIVWHARNISQAAAQEGLRVADGYQSNAAAGRDETLTYLRQIAPHALPDPDVRVTRTATTATVTVHAQVMTLLPFGHFSVTESATGPVETYVSAP
jgi:Flp pilus assembly protein TadG